MGRGTTLTPEQVRAVSTRKIEHSRLFPTFVCRHSHSGNSRVCCPPAWATRDSSGLWKRGVRERSGCLERRRRQQQPRLGAGRKGKRARRSQ